MFLFEKLNALKEDGELCAFPHIAAVVVVPAREAFLNFELLKQLQNFADLPLLVAMPKRRRKELNDSLDAPRRTEKKKPTTPNPIKPAKKSSEVPKSKSQAVVVPEEIAPSKPTAVRIVVGSYEKILCGIDAHFDTQTTEQVSSFSIVA